MSPRSIFLFVVALVATLALFLLYGCGGPSPKPPNYTDPTADESLPGDTVEAMPEIPPEPIANQVCVTVVPGNTAYCEFLPPEDLYADPNCVHALVEPPVLEPTPDAGVPADYADAGGLPWCPRHHRYHRHLHLAMICHVHGNVWECP